MAKVNGPLMSMEASGTIGNTITFDRRGFVRTRVIPTNPKSDAQGNVRQMLLAVQKTLTLLGAAAIAAVKTLAPVAYRWNSYLLSQVIGPGSETFEASRAAFAALAAPDRANWETRAAALGITQQTIPYASDDPISPGLALFAVSRALFNLGLNVAAGTPAAANYDAWGDYFES
ncbi:MAG TPA: hypothetical protein VF659_15405 [Pyrinomonadaceae bacterium]|jgi:hypothetical protein